MSDCAAIFFDAWAIEDAELRLAKIANAVTDGVMYDDPRTTETIQGIAALNFYVGLFSENAPSWAAKVIKSDTVANVSRVTVVFHGMGPNGTEQE